MRQVVRVQYRNWTVIESVFLIRLPDEAKFDASRLRKLFMLHGIKR